MKFRDIAGVKPDILTKSFWLDTNPLILIDGVTWTMEYENKLQEKKRILSEHKEWQTILFVWWGRYRTDVFELDIDTINLLLK